MGCSRKRGECAGARLKLIGTVMLVGALRADARPVYNVVHKDIAKRKRTKERRLHREDPAYNEDLDDK